MSNVKVTTNANGYVNNFVVIGDLPDSANVSVSGFNADHFDCYKLVDGVLVWDEEKHQEKLNPTPNEPQLSDKERIEQLEQMINLILMGEI